MTDQTPVPPQPEHDRSDEVAPMPPWVPIAIGVVLVTLAALAVITGMRYRDQTLVRIVQPRRPPMRATAPAPPGEPEPGASLIFPTSNVPVAADITGVNGTPRFSARRGLRTNVTPPDAVVYVNDVAIGQANQFDSEDEEYDFAAPGSYTIRLAAPGYKERQFIVTAAENAKDEVARIQVKLEKQ
ncbi:MAG TPA: hypothetical protein VGS96_14855 [Thermoanaerobaculia bacterium]|jgi:hypothetical protein|nr:hypothetical protein [Thermoanaerobaculia bacterium]